MSSSMEPKRASSEYRDNFEILMQIPLFSGLPVEALKVFAYLCKRVSFRPGETIFRRHEVDACAYYIISGRAKLVFENGEEEELRTIGETEFIGGLSLFCDMKRLFTLKADTALTCLMLSKEKFQKTLEQFPQIAGKMFEALVEGIYAWEAGFVREHGLKCKECKASIGVSLV